MNDKVFSVTGNKISSMIFDAEALKFSSATPETFEEFRESFAKKLSLATKIQIKYKSIKSIRKEDNDKNISIIYRTYLGLAGTCVFSLNNAADYEVFFTFFEKERHFVKYQETLTPLRAARGYFFGLLMTIGITVFCYFQAIEIANGTVSPPTNGKARLFNSIVGFLGDKGVMAGGILISLYLGFNMWKRFSNPPDQIRFLPPA